MLTYDQTGVETPLFEVFDHGADIFVSVRHVTSIVTLAGWQDHTGAGAMAGRRIEIELPEELWRDLVQVAEAAGIGNPVEAAFVGLADWIARRKAELDDRDPSQRYFINEALDELARGRKN
jgi:hypothetical protein